MKPGTPSLGERERERERERGTAHTTRYIVSKKQQQHGYQ
jgi:hypothetical protein